MVRGMIGWMRRDDGVGVNVVYVYNGLSGLINRRGCIRDICMNRLVRM